LIYQVENSSRARIVPTDSQRGGWGGHHVNGTAHPGPDALPQQRGAEAKPESARRTANSECSACTLQQASVSAGLSLRPSAAGVCTHAPDRAGWLSLALAAKARTSPRLLLPAALLLQPSNLSPFSSLLSESFPSLQPLMYYPKPPALPLCSPPFPRLHSVEKSVSQG
jgi:hypothetical protein